MNLPDEISPEDFLQAVAEGVRRAVWQIATNATDAPCEDFYKAIREGVSDALERNGTET